MLRGWLQTNSFISQILRVILGFVFVLTMSLTLSSPTVQAQKISDLNVLGVQCIFAGQAVPDGSDECTAQNSLVDRLISFAIGISGVVATLVFIWGGYKYFFGGFTGDAAAGKQAIISGAIGLVLVLSASFIQSTIRSSVGADGQFNTEGIRTLIEDDIVKGILLPLSSVVAVLVIIWGGYKYMFSGLPGDQKDGMDTIKAGITGLVVILLAYAITDFIRAILGGSGSVETLVGGILGLALSIINGFLIPLSSVIALFFFILGGYYWMTSNGDDDKVRKGKEAIKNAVIGLVITLIAATIVQMIIYFVRANIPASQATATIQVQKPPTS